MTDETVTPASTTPDGTGATPPARQGGRPPRGRARPAKAASEPGAPPAPRIHPLLEQLAAWHPVLFGANFLPLKRGIFQDLMDAHPGAMAPEDLKAALAQHTRSTRYLTAMASGQQRHDLQGQPVEALAPEHVYHALQEVFRRRQNRTPAPQDLQPKLVARILQAFDASGLAREDYVALVRGRDERANAALDDAMAQAAARSAKDEALLRAFQASGQADVDAFADMYGMDPRTVRAALARAQRPAVAPAAPRTSAVPDVTDVFPVSAVSDEVATPAPPAAAEPGDTPPEAPAEVP